MSPAPEVRPRRILDGHHAQGVNLGVRLVRELGPDRVVSGGSDGTVRLWSLSDGRLVDQRDGRLLGAVGSLTDGSREALVLRSHGLYAIDADGAARFVAPRPQSVEWSRRCHESPDGACALVQMDQEWLLVPACDAPGVANVGTRRWSGPAGGEGLLHGVGIVYASGERGFRRVGVHGFEHEFARADLGKVVNMAPLGARRIAAAGPPGAGVLDLDTWTFRLLDHPAHQWSQYVIPLWGDRVIVYGGKRISVFHAADVAPRAKHYGVEPSSIGVVGQDVVVFRSSSGARRFDPQTGRLSDAEWALDTASDGGFYFPAELLPGLESCSVVRSGHELLVAEGFCSVRARYDGHDEPPRGGVTLSDGSFVTYGGDCRLHHWCAEDAVASSAGGALFAPRQAPVRGALMTGKDRALVYREDGSYSVETPTGTLAQLPSQGSSVRGVRIADEDRLVVYGSSGDLSIVDANSLATHFELEGHGEPVDDVAVGFGRVVSAGRDGMVRVHSLTFGRRIVRFAQGGVFRHGLFPSYRFAPVDGVLLTDANTVVAASWDGDVSAWSVDGGRRRRLAQHGMSAELVPLGPERFLSFGPRHLHWHRAADGEIEQTRDGGEGRYWRVSRDARVAACSDDYTTMMLDLETTQETTYRWPERVSILSVSAAGCAAWFDNGAACVHTMRGRTVHLTPRQLAESFPTLWADRFARRAAMPEPGAPVVWSVDGVVGASASDGSSSRVLYETGGARVVAQNAQWALVSDGRGALHWLDPNAG